MSIYNIKKEGVLAILIFILFISYSQLYKLKETAELQKSEINVIQTYESVMPSFQEVSMHIINKEEREKIKTSLIEFQTYADEAKKALTKKDFQTYTHNMTKLCLLSALYRFELYTASGLSGSISETDLMNDKINMEHMLEQYDMTSSSYSFLVKTDLYGNPESVIQEFSGIVRRAQMYMLYHEHNLVPMSSASYGAMSSIYLIYENLSSVLLIVLSALICMDMIFYDKQSGTLKLLLTQPKKRCYYLKRLCFQYFNKIAVLFLLPLFSVFLITGVSSTFADVNAPVLAYEKGFMSFKGLDNNIKKTNYIYNEEKEIYFFNTRISPLNPGDMEPQPDMGIMPFWKVILACTLFSAVLLMFYVVLHLFFHILLTNPIAAASTGLLISFVLAFLSPPETATAIYNLINPITSRNPIYAVTGYIGFSFLWSIIVLIVSIFVLFIISCLLFKRKDI